MSARGSTEHTRREIQAIQESIAFLERRLDEYASVADELASRLEQTHKRLAALEAGASRMQDRIEKPRDEDQSGAGQPE